MWENVHDNSADLGCVSLRKSKIGFSNPKESENGFCVSLLDRSIQDLSDHVAKNPPLEWIRWFIRCSRTGESQDGRRRF